MFTLTEAQYQLLRNRGRSVLLICISALLCGCLALYIGNMNATQQALYKLGETNPITLQVSSRNGLMYDNLDIDTELADQLLELGLSNIQISSRANAAYEEASKQLETFLGGDSLLLAINCKEVAGFADEDDWDLEFFTGEDALCAVADDFAKMYNVKVGDTISLQLCQTLYGGTLFQKIGDDVELKVAAICTRGSTGYTIYVPLEWMRRQTEAAGFTFKYTSFSGIIDDPLKLNEIKSKITEMGFVTPFSEYAANIYQGDAVSMDDEVFIKNARRLGESLAMSQQFLPAFCGVVALLVTLAVFLVLRGARREIAIASSLGRPKALIGLSHLIALLCTQLAGCILTFLIMVLAGLGLEALIVCGGFMICAVIGDLVGLFLVLRFDPIKMLLAE